MADVLDLEDFRNKHIETRAFGAWKKRFGKAFSKETGLADISDKMLYYLAQPGEQSAHAFYELIMGVLDVGPASKLTHLAEKDQLRVMEIHLFLADLFRFEMMRRLGWINPFVCREKSLIDLVENFDQLKIFCRKAPPELCETHPDRPSYEKLHERDREGFIRRLLPSALEIFKRRINA